MRLIHILPAALLVTASSSQSATVNIYLRNPAEDAPGNMRAVLNLNIKGRINIDVACEHDRKLAVKLTSLHIYYYGTPSAPVTVIIDGGEPVRLMATYDGPNAKINDDATPDSVGGQFLMKLRTAKHLSLDLVNENGRHIRNSFDLGDARQNIDQMLTGCQNPAWAQDTATSVQ